MTVKLFPIFPYYIINYYVFLWEFRNIINLNFIFELLIIYVKKGNSSKYSVISSFLMTKTFLVTGSEIIVLTI